MSETLAVKYRPKSFDDVCEQSAIIKILDRQLSINDIKNAYLFCGASGCGKTTVARIFANKINKGCGNPIEIDGASNNGVDAVKAIIHDADERAIDSEYKVYIIDECHMLTTAAWNAFLKCIEEPPKYTIFIFCTTDPQKIPNTILNRVMRFNFSRMKTKTIKDRLTYICNCEGYTNFEESVDYISKLAEGGMRNAISMLDKVAGYGVNFSIDSTLTALGNYSYDVFFALINAIIDDDEKQIFSIISYYYDEGNDLKVFIDNFLSFCMDVCKYSIFKSCDVTVFPESFISKLDSATNFDNSTKYYTYYVDKLLSLKQMLKNDSSIKTTIEIVLTQMGRLK